jgi:uncharacterized protein (DUF983 family)
LTDKPPSAAPTATRAALGGLCPRCGARTLYDGLLRFAPSCRACGLALSSFNVGDGPAAFLTLIVGALVTALAIAVQLAFHPPFWVHLILWVPVAAIAVIGLMRVAKALLLALEYRHRAAEGRVAGRDDKG